MGFGNNHHICNFACNRVCGLLWSGVKYDDFFLYLTGEWEDEDESIIDFDN